MKTRVVARRYAEAFYKVIEAEGLESAYQEFTAFSALAGSSSELGVVLRHPAIRYERKQALVLNILAQCGSPRIAEFVLLLIKRHRFFFFDQIVEEVISLYKRNKSIIPATVKSAVPLTDEERRTILDKLNTRVRGTIELEEIVDPSIQGGLQICFEDKILDASVKSKLKLLREKLSSLNQEMLANIAPPTTLA